MGCVQHSGGLQVHNAKLVCSSVFIYASIRIHDSKCCIQIYSKLSSYNPCLNYRPPTLPSCWPLSDDCPDNYEHGMFMLTLGQLVEKPCEVRRFHLWYMHAAKVGLRDFIVTAPQGVLPLGRKLSFHCGLP